MNEITRYDQELAATLQDLPMPSEEIAWAEMEKLLNKDDDNPAIVPFYRRWGCMLLGLLIGLLLAGGGWWYFNHSSEPEPKETGEAGNQISNSTSQRTVSNADSGTYRHTTSDSFDHSATRQTAGSSTVLSSPDSSTIAGNQTVAVQTKTTGPGTKVQVTGAATSAGKDWVYNKPGDEMPGVKQHRNRKSVSQKQKVTISAGLAEGVEITGKANSNKKNDGGKGNAAMTITSNDDKIKSVPFDTAADNTGSTSADSVNKKKDSLVKAPVSNQNATTGEKQKKKNWTVAAGLSIYQPIKLSGETSVPYNFYGRKGRLTDYIPSAYLRVYRNKRWYLHTEFRYGAPQAVKPFEYKKELIDSTPVNYTTANFRLRKTYYHQVPLGLHCFVLPKLSIGAGIIFNRFTGALSDKDTYKRVGGQTDSLQSSVLVNDKEDSRFSMNHLQWSAEINYNWKRLFFGARFSRDINPYIKYNDIITVAAVEKKMQALNVFLRYELWRSKKKN